MNLILSLALQVMITSPGLSPQPLSRLPADLQPLIKALISKGFKVLIALPPIRGSYGSFQSKNKTLWISPVTFPLGIARQTFLHEAVHAIQSCPSGKLTPVGWNVSLTPVVEREIRAILLKSYHHANRKLEQEAFFLQGQKNAPSILIQSLKQRCIWTSQNVTKNDHASFVLSKQINMMR